MQTAMSNQQQRQMIWSRKLAQMDHDTQLASAKKEGRAEGRTAGIAEGTNKAMSLMSRLFSLGRTNDAMRAATDEDFRRSVYAEFGMSEN